MGREIVYRIKTLIGKNKINWVCYESLKHYKWHFSEGPLDGLSGCALMIFKQAKWSGEAALSYYVTDSLLPIHALNLVQKLKMVLFYEERLLIFKRSTLKFTHI